MEEHDPYFFFEHVTTWIGSVQSLLVHTCVFILCGLIGSFGIADWNTVLLVLTTAVSLEAIYLAIFIQMTVNHHSEELEEVSEDIDEIQEDIDEIQEDVDEMQEDVEDIQEDDLKDAERRALQMVTLEQLTEDVQRVLKDLESFKNGTPKTSPQNQKSTKKKTANVTSSDDQASRGES